LILRLSVDASFFLKELCILTAYSPRMCDCESKVGVTDPTFSSTHGLLQDMSIAEPRWPQFQFLLPFLITQSRPKPRNNR
jgi:hypothetical protein